MSKPIGSFLNGFIMGGLMGAAITVLFAPQSGEKTREKILDKGTELKSKAEMTYVDAQKKMASALTELQTTIDELSAKVDQVITHFGEEVAAEVGHLAEVVAPDDAAEIGESA